MNLTRTEDRALPHYVYVCYDADGWILYIGCSKDVAGRILTHVKNRGWWTNHLRHVRAIGPMPWADAFELEARLINRLAPLANRESNPIWKAFEADLWREQTEKHGTAIAAQVIESMRATA